MLRQSRSFRAANPLGTLGVARFVTFAECIASVHTVASLPRFGKPSDYGVLRQSRSFRAANQLGTLGFARFVTFAECTASVHTSLRSLGLENRATMECCGKAAAFVLLTDSEL